jgi:hypothetical protein
MVNYSQFEQEVVMTLIITKEEHEIYNHSTLKVDIKSFTVFAHENYIKGYHDFIDIPFSKMKVGINSKEYDNFSETEIVAFALPAIPELITKDDTDLVRLYAAHGLYMNTGKHEDLEPDDLIQYLEMHPTRSIRGMTYRGTGLYIDSAIDYTKK